VGGSDEGTTGLSPRIDTIVGLPELRVVDRRQAASVLVTQLLEKDPADLRIF